MWYLYVLKSWFLCDRISLDRWPEGFCVFCLPRICPVRAARVTDTYLTVTCFYLLLLDFMFLQGTKTGHRTSAFTHYCSPPLQNWILTSPAIGNAKSPFSLLHGFWWTTLTATLLFYITVWFFKMIHKVLKMFTDSTIDLPMIPEILYFYFW